MDHHLYVKVFFLGGRIGYLVRDDMRWRVKNGKNIKIWEIKWLPTPSTHIVQSPVKNLNKEATINELINEGKVEKLA